MNDYIEIKKIFNIEKGSLQSTKCIEGDFDFITASSEWKKHNKYTHDKEALVVAVSASGSLGRVHYVKGKFIASDLCFILTQKSHDRPVNMAFYYSIFKSIRDDLVKSTATGTSKLAINKTNFGNYKVPYIEIQSQNELEQRLTLIKEKREKLLNLNKSQRKSIKNLFKKTVSNVISNETATNNITYTRIGDIFDIQKGQVTISKAIEGMYPLVVTAEERLSHNEYQFNLPNGAILIPMVSSTGHGHASLKRIHFQKGKFALGNILCALVPFDYKLINAEFYFYLLNIYKEELIVSKMKGAANVGLSITNLSSIMVPLFSSEVQEVTLNLLTSLNNLRIINKTNFEVINLLEKVILREILFNQ